MMISSHLLVSVALAVGAVASVVPAVEERAACNADNVLRALRNPTRSAQASTFCSTYIQSTTTVTEGIITITSATTVPGPSTTDVSTETVEVTRTIDTTVLFPGEDPTITVTTTVTPVAKLIRRDGAIPTIFPFETVPASRISSACSCFVTPSPQATVTITTVSTTTTSPTVTLPGVTVLSTTTFTESTTVTIPTTSTLAPETTEFTTVTVTATL